MVVTEMSVRLIAKIDLKLELGLFSVKEFHSEIRNSIGLPCTISGKSTVIGKLSLYLLSLVCS